MTELNRWRHIAREMDCIVAGNPMKHLAILVFMTALLATSALPATAQAPPPKRAQVEADLANLLSQEAELKDQVSKIEARDRDETERNAALAKDIAAYEAEQARLTEDDRRYVGSVTSHNAACGGSFTDKAHVEQCNNRKRELEAQQAAITDRDAALAKRHGELTERSKELQNEMDDTARRKRETKASLDKIQKTVAARREFIRLDESFLADPRKRDQFGRTCADLAAA
jgi:chromosome segregation ATPase